MYLRTWQLLKADVMHNLVISPLQESGVDCTEGGHPFAGQPSSKGDSMLLRNAHVKGAAVEALLESVHACAATHSSMHTNDAAVSLCFSYQGVGKEVGVGCNLHHHMPCQAAQLSDVCKYLVAALCLSNQSIGIETNVQCYLHIPKICFTHRIEAVCARPEVVLLCLNYQKNLVPATS